MDPQGRALVCRAEAGSPLSRTLAEIYHKQMGRRPAPRHSSPKAGTRVDSGDQLVLRGEQGGAFLHRSLCCKFITSLHTSVLDLLTYLQLTETC